MVYYIHGRVRMNYFFSILFHLYANVNCTPLYVQFFCTISTQHSKWIPSLLWLVGISMVIHLMFRWTITGAFTITELFANFMMKGLNIPFIRNEKVQSDCCYAFFQENNKMVCCFTFSAIFFFFVLFIRATTIFVLSYILYMKTKIYFRVYDKRDDKEFCTRKFFNEKFICCLYDKKQSKLLR